MSAGEDVLVVEWADRAAAIFPADALWIALGLRRRRPRPPVGRRHPPGRFGQPGLG